MADKKDDIDKIIKDLMDKRLSLEQIDDKEVDALAKRIIALRAKEFHLLFRSVSKVANIMRFDKPA